MALEYGLSIDGVTDTEKTWGLASPGKTVANAIARRLTTPAGALFYDPVYGFDVRSMLNGPQTDEIRNAAVQKIEEQCLADERVLSATATLTFSDDTTINISVTGELANTGAFTLVLLLTNLSVTILEATV